MLPISGYSNRPAFMAQPDAQPVSGMQPQPDAQPVSGMQPQPVEGISVEPPPPLVNSDAPEQLNASLRQPAHVPQSTPFDVNGYDSLSLIGEEGASRNADETPKRHGLGRLKGIFKLSLDSSREVTRDSVYGVLFGGATGLLISALRFRFGVSEFLNQQKRLGFLMMPGLPILGAIMGGSMAAFQSANRQADKLTQWVRNAYQ